MKTRELFEILNKQTEKALFFEYQPNKFVASNYHITEVKHLKIKSVDCGVQTDSWNETIVQLWESPSEPETSQPMSVLKALGILKKVGKIKTYDLDSEIKFEYGNSDFHTAQLFIHDYQINSDRVILQLGVTKTQCKAEELCGIAPETNQLQTAQACCSPGSGCC